MVGDKTFKSNIILISIIIITTFLLILINGCTNEEMKIEMVKEKIDASKSCNLDSECVELNLGCPFGCTGPVVNKIYENQIRNMASNIQPCDYRCINMLEPNQINEIGCIEHSCGFRIVNITG
ncbi:hypothetical protein ACFL1H_06560 [Nanoarchaeota archaeon]